MYLNKFNWNYKNTSIIIVVVVVVGGGGIRLVYKRKKLIGLCDMTRTQISPHFKGYAYSVRWGFCMIPSN